MSWHKVEKVRFMNAAPQKMGGWNKPSAGTQTKLSSFAESWINVIIGLIINVTAQVVVFKAWGFHTTWKDNLSIALIFTVISVIRSYTLRRIFNYIKWGNSNGV